MQPDAHRLAQDLKAVMDISRAMGSERNLDRLLGLIVKSVTQVVRADRTSLFLVDREKQHLVTRVSQGADEIRLPLGSGIAGSVAATGTAINIPHAYADVRFNRDHDRSTGYITRSILCLPLTNYSGEVVGVIQALNKLDGEPFNAYDEQVLAALCGSAAVAIDNALLIARDRDRQRMENELELARQIQLSLLPAKPPEVVGWRVASWCRSCDQTGGDYVDFIPCADGQLDVVVGDVSGHGIAAALLMSTARAFLRALLERGDSPATTITSLNRLLEADLSDDSFMTMVLARLAQDGSCCFVSAGHEPPLVWRRSGTTDELTSSGLPLGMLDDSTYDAGMIPVLAAGDLLVLFTDGIPDAHAPPDNQMWGLDHLRATVTEHAAQGAQAVCDAVVAAVTAALRGAHSHDDMTLVVIERLPERDVAPMPKPPLTIAIAEPPASPPVVFERSWPSRIDLKQEIIDQVVEQLLTRGWVTEDDRTWLYLCFDEVLVNAMLHGNEGDPRLEVTIALRADEQRWIVTIADQGEGFSETAVPDQAQAESLVLEHGRGIRLMQEFLDELTYYRGGSLAWLARHRADAPRPSL